MDALSKKHRNENIAFSPLSIITLLSMVADATTGSAKQEVLAFLGGAAVAEETCELLRSARASIERGPGLTSANAVVVEEELREKITAGYEKALKQKYNGQLILSHDIIHDVNRWVKKKTKGRIQNMVDETQSDAPIFMLNAVTFDARWKVPYKEDDIWDEKFTDNEGNSSLVPMLHSMETSYLEDGYFIGFVKPYKGNTFDFIGLLPREEGAAALQEAILGLNLSGLYRSGKEERVYISMPEFRCSFGDNLSDICQRLGIKTVFTEYADFSPLAKEPLMLGEILHKAYIEVDQKGTRAAAATRGEVLFTGVPSFNYKIVNLDRPFVHAVVHRKTGLPVFVGLANRCEKLR